MVRDERARLARWIIAGLLVGVAWASRPFLSGLLGAVVLASLFSPVHRRMARWGVRRSALAVTLAAALLLVAPTAWLVLAVLPRAPVALQHIASSDVFARVAALQIGSVDVGVQLARAAEAALVWGSRNALAAAGGLTRALLNVLLALLGLYYLLIGGASLWRSVRGFIPFSRAGTDVLQERFSSITQATLLGMLATAAAQGLIVALGFLIVGLPNALTWGLVTAGVSILPILGSAMVWVPGVIVLAADHRPGAALTLGLVGLVLASNIDNVVRPFVYRRVSNLHPMLTLVGAFAGVNMFGLIGLLLGPLALAYCVELVRLYHAEYGEHTEHDPHDDEVVAPVSAKDASYVFWDR
jgi:predicted PurR-regulated permease PerM